MCWSVIKDDKSYPFIKITVGEEYPRVLFARKMKHGAGKYFGPYTSAAAVKDTIELLCKLYKVRTCNRNLPKDEGKDRPCLNYHIGQCDAPCQGYVSGEEYRRRIDEVVAFLNGDYKKIMDRLTTQMQEASEKMEYEEAARYRDLLMSVKQVAQKQKITADDVNDRDVIACASDGQDAVVQVFFIRQGKLLGRDHFHMKVAEGDSKSDIISEFMKQYYGGTPFIPNIIMVQYEIEDADTIAQWLSARKSRKVSIVTPKKGDKEKMVELAYKNAQLVLTQDAEKIKREESRTTGAMKEIAGWLGLGTLHRAEAYDISNTNGVESVGSMVVFEDGKPKKNDYRKFRIRTVKGPDDYKSMREVLTRRFTRGMREREGLEDSHGFSRYPDLIMMDGGRGQVNIALDVLKELGLNIPVCGMVKDDTHSTRGLYYNNIEIPIDKHSEGFKLITRVQDEAHRFAITYHRSLRDKAQVSSVLDSIEGIGPVRRKALIQKMNLVNLTPQIDVSGIWLNLPDVNRPALQLTGFYDQFDNDRLQIIGNVEHAYLASLSEQERYERYMQLLSSNIPCIIFCRSIKPEPKIIELAVKYQIPLLMTDQATSSFTAEVIRWLKVQLAPCIVIHGVLVDVYGVGVLITGESGIGKSEAALELIKRGHRLVTDDAVEIRKVSDETLVGSAPGVTKYFIELRGIGIIDVKTLFGVESVKETQEIDMVIKLEDWNKDREYDRLGLEEEYIEYLGNKVVCHTLPVRPGRNLAVIVESAAVNHRQKMMGYNAAKELYRRVQENLMRGGEDDDE